MILACGPGEHRPERSTHEFTQESPTAVRGMEAEALWLLAPDHPRAVPTPVPPLPTVVAIPPRRNEPAGVGDIHDVYVPGGVLPDAPNDVDWRGIVQQYDWDWAVVERIILCESGGRADAVSADGANIGLLQINVIHRARVGGDISRLYDAATNIAVGYAIYRDNHGFGPWSCY